MEPPRISIVTPSYNQGRFIEETIQSVLSQNYPNLEYLIVDGGSTDSSVDIIRRYSDQLAHWESTEDRGQSDAINKGFRRSTGDIIAFLNSDDRYCPGALGQVSRLFLENSEWQWLCGNVLFTDAGGNIVSRKKPVYSPFVLRSASSSLLQPGVFLRRSILEDAGYIRDDFHAVMDQEWFCRIADCYRPAIVDVDIALFRWHTDSKSSSVKSSRQYQRYVEEKVVIGRKYFPALRPAYDRSPRLTVFILEQAARLAKLLKRMQMLWERSKN
jgi:glycosyltransferase involved in cell wall biosynthesis